jgi:hypothetical protein
MNSKGFKIISIIAILFLCQTSLMAQIKAVTDTGDEVILFNDKTWKFQNEKNVSIQKSTNYFSKGSNSTFLVKSKINRFGVHINPKVFEFKRDTKNSDNEFDFTNRKKTTYGFMINEGIELPLSTLRDYKVNSLKDKATSLDILDDEYRIVNGITILYLRIRLTTKDTGDTPLIFCMYFATAKSSTTQLISWTSETNFNKSSDEIFELLNGISKLDVEQ